MAMRHNRLVAYISHQEDLELSMGAWPGDARDGSGRQLDAHSWLPLTGLAGMSSSEGGAVSYGFGPPRGAGKAGRVSCTVSCHVTRCFTSHDDSVIGHVVSVSRGENADIICGPDA